MLAEKGKTKKNHQLYCICMVNHHPAPRFHRQAQRRVPCAEHRGPGRAQSSWEPAPQAGSLVGFQKAALLLPSWSALPQEKLEVSFHQSVFSAANT